MNEAEKNEGPSQQQQQQPRHRSRHRRTHTFIQRQGPLYNAGLTLVELQFHFGGNQVKFQVVCPQIGTAVLKGLIGPVNWLGAWCLVIASFLQVGFPSEAFRTRGDYRKVKTVRKKKQKKMIV